MAKGLSQKQIQAAAQAVVDSHPDGIRWSEIIEELVKQYPGTPPNSIHGATYSLLKSSGAITKISKGVYAPAAAIAQKKAEEQDQVSVEPETVTVVTPEGSTSLKEDDFYPSLLEWLQEQLEEINEGMVLGGSVLGGKWGTPDVFGVLKPRTADLVKFESQIVSAELKISTSQTIVAFGQAVSYRLFSHKSYIAVPNGTAIEDLSRLEALCIINGLGLITFDLVAEQPNYALRVRAVTGRPDMYYVNQVARRLSEHAAKDFERMF